MHDSVDLRQAVISAFTHPVLLFVRGVTGKWHDDTLYLEVYYDGLLTEEERDDISEACGIIIADYETGFLNEKYIRWDEPKPLPTVKEWLFPPPKEWVKNAQEQQKKLSEKTEELIEKARIPNLKAVNAEWTLNGYALITYYIKGPVSPSIRLEAKKISKRIVSGFSDPDNYMFFCVSTSKSVSIPSRDHMIWIDRE